MAEDASCLSIHSCRVPPLPNAFALQRILRSKPADRIMIFCTTKRMCDQLSHSIAREFRSAAIHGDKRQQERDYVLNAFKQVRVMEVCLVHEQACEQGQGFQIVCRGAPWAL